MVRFIIRFQIFYKYRRVDIYIPIWLDLLLKRYYQQKNEINNLHSNMVRFIIKVGTYATGSADTFTFQYGQIYYEIKEDEAKKEDTNLHSNMVRFIIKTLFIITVLKKYIYIPIWLDLLLASVAVVIVQRFYLHSNMVRFIINFIIPFGQATTEFTFQYGQIYYWFSIN